MSAARQHACAMTGCRTTLNANRPQTELPPHGAGWAARMALVRAAFNRKGCSSACRTHR
ncbi:hypothetical protein BRADO3537 [Bradyrhizobium sp. ORS 278]|nr:hypothetical protein BRADO3537 [Bradyrhizobium sp. ORS 278]